MLNIEQKKEIFPQKMKEATLLGLYLIYMQWQYRKLYSSEVINEIKITNDYQIIHVTNNNDNELDIISNKNILLTLQDLHCKFTTHTNLCVNINIYTQTSIDLALTNQTSNYLNMAKYYIGFFDDKKLVEKKIPQKFSLLNYFLKKEKSTHIYENYLNQTNSFKWEIKTDEVAQVCFKLVEIYTKHCQNIIKLFSDELDKHNIKYFSYEHVENNISNIIQFLYDNINSDHIMVHLDPEFQKLLLDDEIKDTLTSNVKSSKLKI